MQPQGPRVLHGRAARAFHSGLPRRCAAHTIDGSARRPGTGTARPHTEGTMTPISPGTAVAAEGAVGSAPPSHAIVLFDGGALDAWTDADDHPSRWRRDQGALIVEPGQGDLFTRRAFGDFQLHLEFWLPEMPAAGGQDRANSGVYLQGRYELQILDSFGMEHTERRPHPQQPRRRRPHRRRHRRRRDRARPAAPAGPRLPGAVPQRMDGVDLIAERDRTRTATSGRTRGEPRHR